MTSKLDIPPQGNAGQYYHLLHRGLYLKAVTTFITAHRLVSMEVSLWEKTRKSGEDSQKENTSWADNDYPVLAPLSPLKSDCIPPLSCEITHYLMRPSLT